jgi:hypothetical protein
MSHVLSRALISSKQGTCEALKRLFLRFQPELSADRYIDGRLYAGPLYRRQILPGAFDLIAK